MTQEKDDGLVELTRARFDELLLTEVLATETWRMLTLYFSGRNRGAPPEECDAMLAAVSLDLTFETP